MSISKVIYDGNTLIDLTDDTAVADKVLSGYTFHTKAGDLETGSCTYDADTSDADAVSSEILSTKTAYVNGTKITGNMINNGAVTGTITAKTDEYTVPVGYHDGSGKVSISSTEQAKIIATNIRTGITVLGVTGTMTGTEDVNAEAVTCTPSSSQQVIVPGTGYNFLSQVTVSAIPYRTAQNSAGGLTVTIG